jgi:DUF2971 family protein
MDEAEKKVATIFTPHAVREMQRLREEQVRFVHYTSADTGLKILSSQEMLLRNSTLMNDFSEVRYGLDCLIQTYNGAVGERLKAAIKSVQADLPEILEGNFNQQIVDIANETYLLSLSEHDGDFEDSFGRLSMWRAYAAKDGVAFVLKGKPFASESDAIQAFSSPVIYVSPQEFEKFFGEIVDNIENNIDFVKSLGGKYVHDILTTTFRFAAQSTKHPAFREEREWRVIYTPTALAEEGLLTKDQNERIPTRIMSIRGVPQRVYAIPFKDYPDEGLIGATTPDLIDRVLIGPSADAYMIAQAYVAELENVGMANAHQKVHITGIPLRSD